MAKNVGSRSLGRPIPDAQRPRNPFNRTSSVKLNQKSGHAIPAHWFLAPAGSHVRINRKEFMRTFNIITSSFVPFTHYLDIFAVKMSDLWSYWDNWYLNINDQHSSFGNAIQNFESSGSVDIDDQVKMRQDFPSYSMFTILTLLDGASGIAPATGELSYPDAQQSDGDIRRMNARRLLHHLRYAVAPAGELDSSGKYCNLTPDSFGYVSDKSNQVQNLAPLCAYQKICYEWYRNTSYLAQNPFYYNLDWLGAQNGSQVTQNNLSKMMARLTNLHSVNWRKDFYQSAYPALDYIPDDQKQYDWSVPDNVVNAFAYLDSVSGNDNFRWRISSGDDSINGDSRNVWGGTPSAGGSLGLRMTNDDESGSNLLLHTHTYQQSLAPNAYNVQAIRAAFALDKLRRATAYASQHIKDQYEARFGFKFKGDQHHTIRIGSFKSKVTPFEVTATSASSASGTLQPLGTIGGKGLGFSDYQDEISFDCQNCDYIIMAISYFVPDLAYDGLHFDPFLIKHGRNDFFQPEFENLGLQPVYQKLISWSVIENNPQLADAANNILRYYQTRYQEYKTDVDRNFGLFGRGCMLSPFTSHFNLDKRVFGLSGLDWRFFKVLPDDVDNMFVTQSEASMLSDHFFGVIDFDIRCTQLMSVHGQPDL